MFFNHLFPSGKRKKAEGKAENFGYILEKKTQEEGSIKNKRWTEKERRRMKLVINSVYTHYFPRQLCQIENRMLKPLSANSHNTYDIWNY